MEDIQYNKKCYTFEEIRYNRGFFDDSVDATYIVHLENNGRMDRIQEQLSLFQPTQLIYLVHNQGFKQCEKKAKEIVLQTPYQDLTDAFLQCFAHANEQGYNHILILEDDFVFFPEIMEKKNIEPIQSFLQQKQDDPFLYYLGCIPVITYPLYPGNHWVSIKSLTAHAVIYSREARNQIVDLGDKHWDLILEKNVPYRYLYHIPLCYQFFPETENKQFWTDKDNPFITWVKNSVIHRLHMDTDPVFGFQTLYTIAKTLFLLFVFFLFLLVIYTIHFSSRLYHVKMAKNRRR